MLSRIKNSLVFQLEQLMMRGPVARFALILVVMFAVVLVAGVLVHQLIPGFDSLGDAAWWVFEHVVVPEYVDGDEGVIKRTVATALIVLGSILFAGAIIAILVQWLEYTILKLESGVTPVVLSDHIIILGWTHRTPTIVSELLHTGSRLQRFLEREDVRELRIVVLAEHVDRELARELRERVGDLWNARQVLLRSGTPLQLDDLERVAFRDAAVLILPGAGFAERNPEYVDAETVKTLMSMSKDAIASGSTPPLAVVELYDGRRAAVARRAYAAGSEIVVADEIISRIIAQCVRQRGLCALFKELFTLNQGNGLQLRQLADQAGSSFREIRGTFDKAIVLGTLRPGDQRPNLNPDPDTVLAADDWLVFIARSFEDCASRGIVRPGAPAPAAPTSRPAAETRRLLILGWSRRVPALLREFGRYGKDAFEIDIVSATPIAERESALKRYGYKSSNKRVQQIEAGYTLPGALNRLEPQRYDNIVVLASEQLAEEQQADAITVFTYLLLRGLPAQDEKGPALFFELLEKENEALFQSEEDVIVTPSLVSYLLSQVALRRELAALSAELCGRRGAQLVLLPAQDYLATDGPVCFVDVERAAIARGEIALGVRHAQGPDAGLTLNPDRATRWSPAPGDEVLVLASGPARKSESEGA